MKKLFTLFLALAASVGTLFASTKIGDLYYNLNATDQTAQVTSQNGSYPYWSTTITTADIPASVTYRGTTYSVTSIGYEAFAGCSSLTSVTIPNSVTSIGDRAFDGCSGLTSMTIPNSVTSIGNYAFEGCGGLTSVTIPNSVTSIGGYAFAGCSGLTSVTIPNSVTSIGDYAFYSVNNIIYSGEATGSPWGAKSVNGYVDGYLVYSDETKTNLIGCSSAATGEIVIPNSVTSIGNRAFSGCSGLTSVTIPNSVTSIGDYAFSSCIRLRSITIPNSVISIGGNAFLWCSSLTSVTIPNSVTSIGGEAFYNCGSLTSVTIGNSVTSIGIRAFDGCSSLTSVTIPNSVTSIGDGAFYGCSSLPVVDNLRYADTYLVEAVDKTLSSYTIRNGTRWIGDWAFDGCSSLTSVTIPNSVTSIGEGAFYYCSSLTSVTIPNSVTSIGYMAFSGCSGLTSVTLNSNAIVSKEYGRNSNIGNIFGSQVTEYIIGEGVTSIGNYAFQNCSGLTSVTIPNSVTSIGEEAFYGCSSLTAPIYNAHVFAFMPTSFSGAYTIPNGIESIAGSAFRNCSGLTSVTIPNSVTSIGNNAFYGCSSLTSVTVEAGNTVYDSRNNCNAIIETSTNTLIFGCQNSTIPNSVTSIRERAFRNCSGLTSVTIPNSVTSIGNYAFQGCSGLTSVTIGNSVTSIGDYAFMYCSSLTSVTIPNSVTSIGIQAFYGCSSLTSVTIGNGVTSIGSGAFYDCSSLTSIYVPCGEMERFKQMLNNDSRINDLAPLPYTITISATNGIVIYPQTVCDDMLLNATPDYGYHFVKWSDGNTDNPRTFVLTQDTTFAAEFAVDQSGVCGDDNLLTWTFDDENKTLAISGEGTLNSNYTFGVEAPTQTERLIIAEGVTSVGNNAFNDMSSTITSLALPSTMTEIGDYAFAGMNNRKFNTLVLPNTIIRIGAHAFDGASYLQTIHFGSTLEEIGDYAFNGCTRVKQMTCLAEITPNVGTDGLTSINSLAELYVPNEYLFDYQIDSNWSRFVLKPYGATETTVTDNDVAVDADDNTATFTWPTSNTADSYTIDITKDGVLFCQLTFNANGQLTGIAFAPGRDGQSMAPAATLTTSGMQFTVTGLNSGTNYAFNLTVKSGSTVVATYSGSFTTTGTATSTNVLQSALAPRKFIRDNQVLILRDGKTYTIQGVEVK